ncbi:MAG: PQQ-binding-like beta-propeller repeat protein [Acidobacteriota bacterium]|jgi:outer membrane protein assembly factor BamB
MPNTAWYRNLAVLWILVILLPPLGLVLLWMRRDSRLTTKMLAFLAAAAFGLVPLFLFWGLRMEMDGSLTHPIFAFKNPEKHSAEIEKLRIEERSVDASQMQPPQPESTPGVSAIPATEPAPRPKPAVDHAYWSEFRGPGHNGIYAEGGILTDWPSGKLPLLWKRPVGGGYASAVVADGLIFTIEQRRHKEVVAAYALDSGREQWIHGWDAEFRETMGGDGPRATPTWYEGRLYALGAAGELRCLDARSGSRIWSRNILQDNQAENIHWGMAASPLIADDKVIVLPGGPHGESVVAYNRLTGVPIWKALDDRQAYTSPQLVNLAGRRQILIVSASRAMGLAVESGSLLWEYPWVTHEGINVAQPIVLTDNRFFISAGYDHGAAAIEVFPKNDGYGARAVWQNNRMKNKFSSSVLYEGYVYGFDEAILACIDPATGDSKWKGGRYGYGQLLLASGYLVISSESGEVVLVKASPEGHQEIARFQAIEGKTWNVPVIAEGRLIVRNSTEMACFRIGNY